MTIAHLALLGKTRGINDKTRQSAAGRAGNKDYCASFKTNQFYTVTWKSTVETHLGQKEGKARCSLFQVGQSLRVLEWLSQSGFPSPILLGGETINLVHLSCQRF